MSTFDAARLLNILLEKTFNKKAANMAAAQPENPHRQNTGYNKAKSKPRIFGN